MKFIRRTLIGIAAVVLASFLCLLFYSFSGPRDVDLRRGVPADASLCLSMDGLQERWPQVASSDLRKRLVSRRLLSGEVSPLQGFMGEETLSFYSPQSGLCVASRIAAWQRGAELLWRLWQSAMDASWSRERFMGLDLVGIEQRDDEPALTYFVYGDMIFLMVGAEPSRAKEMAALVLGEGGWGAGRLAGFSPDHFVSLYLRPRTLMEYDLRGEYREARERYGEEHLPPCWKAVEELDAFLGSNGWPSLFDLYEQEASSISEEEELLASLDISGDNAVLEWRRLSVPPPVAADRGLGAYAALLPDSTIAVAASPFQAPSVSGGGDGPVSIAAADDDIRGEYEKRAGRLLSSLDGSFAVAAGRPSLFSALLPACAIFKLKSAANISGEVNGLLDVIAGRALELRAPGVITSFELKAGHRRKEYGGHEYFIMEKSGPFVWSYAQLGDMLVIATHRNLLEDIINAAGDPSRGLSSSARFLQVVEPLGGRGASKGFLDLRALYSQAITALNFYALKEALTSPRAPGEKDPFAPLRTALEVVECVDTVAWEGGEDGGRIVVPFRITARPEPE